ncbi:hypothetical protein KSF78_0002443 [Schistosoma japonicum]|nr:hypothetical protein KSF78_0002443 [Schistosoma japonicum]
MTCLFQVPAFGKTYSSSEIKLNSQRRRMDAGYHYILYNTGAQEILSPCLRLQLPADIQKNEITNMTCLFQVPAFGKTYSSSEIKLNSQRRRMDAGYHYILYNTGAQEILVNQYPTL